MWFGVRRPCITRYLGVTFGELVKDEIVEQTFEALMGTLTLWQQWNSAGSFTITMILLHITHIYNLYYNIIIYYILLSILFYTIY